MDDAGAIQGDPACLDRHPRLRVVLDWWGRHHVEFGRLPSRRDIDPLRLKPALAMLAIAEYHATARRIRFRLVGTAVNDGYGQGELTGRFLDQIVQPADHRRLIDTVERVISTARPDCRPRTVTRPNDGRLVSFDRLLLPLRPLPGEPPMLLAAFGPLTVRKPSLGPGSGR